MDINQKLLRRKITKKKRALNEKLKVKRKYQKLKDHIDDEFNNQITDPLAKKQIEFYNKVFDTSNKPEDVDEQVKNPKNEGKIDKKLGNKLSKHVKENNQEDIKSHNLIKEKQNIDHGNNKNGPVKPKYNRKKAYKLHTAKTKKGQPLMKNVVQNLLHKIKKNITK